MQKNLTDPTSLIVAASKNSVDTLINDPSILNDNAHFDLIAKKLDNLRFTKANRLTAFEKHLTAKEYVDNTFSNSVDDPTLIRQNRNIDFNNHKVTNINTITLNIQALNDNQVITKPYIDQFL